jgi:DNA-binding MarR family transcriptional regulator
VPADDLPLTTLLSQLLIAFTIEFDNEFEHRSRHSTTSGGAGSAGRGPWLASQAMWANFMQFVPEAGLPLREVSDLAHITNLAGLERWRYVVVEPDPADRRPAPPRRDWIVKPTPAGRRAQRVWEPLAGIISGRWHARFGAGAITALRDALQAVLAASGTGAGLPRYLPVVRQQMFADVAGYRQRPPAVGTGPPADLSVLLSQVLLAFTLDFERESAISLPVGASLLRVLTEGGIRVRDLPHLTGVSKEALSMAAGVLARRSCAVTGPDPAASRGKLVRLTHKGRSARDDYARLLGATEQEWRERFGPGQIGALRRSLRSVIDQRDGGQPRLAQGLRPYPDGWRARNPYLRHTTDLLADPSGALPHYPMVLHRGGWPDGS